MERKNLNKFYHGSMGIKDRWAVIKSVLTGSTPGYGVSILSLNKTPLKRSKYEILKNLEDYPILFAVLKKIAENVASVPLKFYVVRKDGKPQKVPLTYLRSKQMRKKILKNEGAEIEELLEHPIISLLDNGNEYMTGRQILEVTQMHIDLLGESFWLLERNDLGVIEKIYPIPPTWVTSVPDADRPFYTLQMGEVREIPATEVIWFKQVSPKDPYGRGLGFGDVLADELDADEFASEHTKAWFYNRARPDILITAPGLTKADTERLEQDFQNKLKGFWNWFKPYFMNADVKIHQLSQSFEGNDVIELRKFERDMIINCLGVPPEILGIVENSNRATIEVADYIFAKRVIEPRLEFLISILQEKLVPNFDEKIIIDYEELTTTDWDIKLEAGKIAPWSLTLNEWREIIGQQPVEGGDVFMLPYNLVPQNISSQSTPQEQKTKSPRRIKKLSEKEVYELLEAVDEWHIAYYVHPVYKKIIEELGQETMNSIGPGLSFNLLDTRITQFLDEQAGIYIKSVQNINETTIKQLRDELIEGVRSGESIYDLSKRVNKVFEDAKGYRAERIARTETLRAFNFAHYTAFGQAGIEYHEWVATRDDRVRDSHLATDGQVVGVGDYFTLGSGARALYPGDPSLPPSESINCRCTLAAVVGKRTMLDTEEKRVKYWWEKEKRMEQYDKLFERAIKKAFQKQQDEILAKLRQLWRMEE